MAHLHPEIGAVDIPTIDPTVFEPYATNIVDGSTSIGSNQTFNNIRIKAGTNPSFKANTTLNGVIFIETPNKVSFAGGAKINGVIVTQDAGPNAYSANTLTFTGNVTSTGVESLPSTFGDLRTKTGAFILAPGFGLSFAGNFGTVNGAIAGAAFNFTGNAGGTVCGPIISYSDSVLTVDNLLGNCHLSFDRSKYDTGHISGLVNPDVLSADATTYREY
jgi:hypothetical protein